MTLLDKFGITTHCDTIHGADNDNKLKKADIITLCMFDLGASPDECILVGDTEHDARGASALGMDFLGVGYGFGFREQNDVSIFPNVGFCKTVKDLSQWIKINTCNQ
jgi:phosphoglycolate phosphatase